MKIKFKAGINIFLTICLIILFYLLITKNRFSNNLLLANINDIIYIIGIGIFFNYNILIGFIIVFTSFVLRLIILILLMPWNFNIVSLIMRAFILLYMIYTLYLRIKKK
jgi:hypothetical protein